jgi:hypothetical protein
VHPCSLGEHIATVNPAKPHRTCMSFSARKGRRSLPFCGVFGHKGA